MEAVPKLPMLQFDVKTSPDNSDFVGEIRLLIQTRYNENPDSFANELEEIAKLRSAACIRPQSDYQGLSNAKRYFCQLHLLRNRFTPDSDHFKFSWHDAYSNRVLYSDKDLDYEMAAVLQNVGALHSRLGAVEARDSSESMKVACTHFQCAAWAFHSLPDMFPDACSLDMGCDLMAILAQTCLAQAQECILEKSILDHRKSAIIAKVGSQVSDYYMAALHKLEVISIRKVTSEALMEMVVPGEETVMDVAGSKMTRAWIKQLEFKMDFYKAVALLYAGMHAEESMKMGERITYFAAASDKLGHCAAWAKDMDNVVKDCLVFVSDIISAKLDNAKKENEFIYHEKVPDLDVLPELKGASLVKGLGFQVDDPEVAGPDVFARLVPFEAHKASSLYSEEKARLLRLAGSDVEAKNTELATFMSSMSLGDEDVVPDTDQHIQLPVELVEVAAALSIQKDDIRTKLEEAMDRIAKVSSQVDVVLKEIRNLLLESKSDVEMDRECQKYEDAHKMASESNSTLHNAIKLHMDNLKLLSLPLDQLQKEIPSLADLDEESEANIAQVRRIMSKIEEMKAQRSMLAEKFRAEVLDDDITKKLVLHKDKELNEIFEIELKKHDQSKALLNQNLAAQTNILQALTDINAKYVDTRRTVKDTINSRNDMIGSLVASFYAHEDLLHKAVKGLEFYDKLDSNVDKLLQRLKATVKEQDAKTMSDDDDKFAPGAPPMPNFLPDDAPLSSSPGLSKPPTLGDYLKMMKETNGDVSTAYAAMRNLGDDAHSLGNVPRERRPAPLGSENKTYLPPMSTNVSGEAAAAVPTQHPLYGYSSANAFSRQSQLHQQPTAGMPSVPPTTAAYQQPSFTTPSVAVANSQLPLMSSLPNLNYHVPVMQQQQLLPQQAPHQHQQFLQPAPDTLHDGTTTTTTTTHQVFRQQGQQAFLHQPALGPQQNIPQLQAPQQFMFRQGLQFQQGQHYQWVPQQHVTQQKVPNLVLQQPQQVPQHTVLQQLSQSQVPLQIPNQQQVPQHLSQQMMPQLPVVQQASQQQQQMYHHQLLKQGQHQHQMPEKQGQQEVPRLQVHQMVSHQIPQQGLQQHGSQNQVSQLVPQQQSVPCHPLLKQGQQHQLMPHLQVPRQQMPQVQAVAQHVSHLQEPWQQMPQVQAVAQQHVPHVQVPQQQVPQIQAITQQPVPQVQVPRQPLPQVQAVTQQHVPRVQVPQQQVPQIQAVSQQLVHQVQVPQPQIQALSQAQREQVPQHQVSPQNEVPQPGLQKQVPQQQQQMPQVQPPKQEQQHQVTQFDAPPVQGMQNYYQSAAPPQHPGPSSTQALYSQLKGSTTFQMTHKFTIQQSNLAKLKLQPVVPQPGTGTVGKRQSATSLDDMLDELDDDDASVVMVPKVMTPGELAEQKERAKAIEDIAQATSKDPYNDEAILEKLLEEVDRLSKSLGDDKFINDKWKLLNAHLVDNKQPTISVARCYPMKNRTSEVLPFDSSRVELPTTKDDYINASHIRHLSPHSPCFIVTQWPTLNTFQDFWIMIWQEQVETIVCTVNSSEQDVYWPTKRDQPLKIGTDNSGLEVTLQSEQSSEDNNVTERIMTVMNQVDNTSRVVIQLQATTDTAQVKLSLVELLSNLSRTCLSYYKQQRVLTHPVLVHCIEGSDRSGAFVLLASSMSEVDVASSSNDDDDIIPDLVKMAALMCQQRKGILRDRRHLKQPYEGLLSHANRLLVNKGVLIKTEVERLLDQESGGGGGSSLNLSSPTKKRITKQDFFKATETSAEDLRKKNETSDDPLSQLDPLWSIKLTK